MKIPANKLTQNKNNKTNSNGIKKYIQKASIQTKNMQNSRNIIQQQQVNNSTSKVQSKSKNEYKKIKNQRPSQGFDQDDDNFDACQHIGTNDKAKKRNPQNIQYEQLLESSGKGFKRQKNSYFLENQKYKGQQRNEGQEQQQMHQDQEQNQMNSSDQNQVGQQQFENEQEENINQQSDEQASNENEIKQALSMLKQKRNDTSKLINNQLEQINAEDQTHLKTVIKNKSKSTQQQYEQAVQLKKLLEIYDKLIELRYGQQKQLQDIKKYPKIDEQLEVPKYPPLNHQLYTASNQLQNEMIGNLSKYLAIFKKLAKKTISVEKSFLKAEQSEQQNQIKIQVENQESTIIDLQQIIQAQVNQNNEDQAPGRLNVDKIYKLIKESIAPQTSLIQKQLIKWSQKTSFLSSTTTTQLNSLLMQTPVGQAKKVMQNWQRLAQKSQQKRGREMFKILFEKQDNIHELSDPQIYDDYDLFIELEKYYLQKLEDDNEDGEFLQSATMKYLKNKQSGQLEHEKKQKDVDRKASKNRKIRYNVHTKLLNFMPACAQNVIQTRDQIVRNMFNCNAVINEQAIEGNVSKYRMAQHHDQTQLIDVE